MAAPTSTKTPVTTTMAMPAMTTMAMPVKTTSSKTRNHQAPVSRMQGRMEDGGWRTQDGGCNQVLVPGTSTVPGARNDPAARTKERSRSTC